MPLCVCVCAVDPRVHNYKKRRREHAVHSATYMHARTLEHWYPTRRRTHPRFLDNPRCLPPRQPLQTGPVDIHQLVSRSERAVIGRWGAVKHLDHVQAGTEGRTAANTDADHVVLSLDESDFVPHHLPAFSHVPLSL